MNHSKRLTLQKASLPTVLITGSSGFLGQAIARGLLDRYRVIGLDVAQPKNPLDGMDTVEIDLTSDESVGEAMAKVRNRAGDRIASVIHLAAYYDTTGEDNPKYDAVTVQGTRRLLDAMKKFETEQFVFSSTLLVHAPSPEKGVKIDEDSPLDPPWAYPRSKAETEALIQERRGAIKSVILRFAGVYDEDCRAAFVAQQIARIFERLPTAYLFTGEITHGQPYLHRDDLVDAVVRTVDRRAKLPDETVLLIGEEETPSYDEMQQRIGDLVHGERWRTLALPKGMTKFGSWVQDEVLGEDTYIKSWMVENSDDHYEIDVSRARTLLGWMPRDRRPDIVRKVARWRVMPHGNSPLVRSIPRGRGFVELCVEVFAGNRGWREGSPPTRVPPCCCRDQPFDDPDHRDEDGTQHKRDAKKKVLAGEPDIRHRGEVVEGRPWRRKSLPWL